jgi:hypothetical protein
VSLAKRRNAIGFAKRRNKAIAPIPEVAHTTGFLDKVDQNLKAAMA